MATTAELVLQLSGKDDASKTIDSVGSSLKGIAGVLGSQAITSGLKDAAGQLSVFTQGAAEDAASNARLQQAITNTGVSYADYSKQMDSVIASGQKLGFTDDQTRNSLALLAAQTGSTEEAVKRYALAQDLARGANIDVETASKLLGKVTAENVNVLGRYGIAAREGMTETELFGMVQEKFGGQAKQFGDSTAGAAQQSAIAMDEMREAMGARLVPAMQTGLSLFQAMPAELQMATAGFMTFGPAIGQTVTGMMALGPALAGLVPALGALGPALTAARTGMMAMGAAMLTPPLGIIVALVAVGVAIYVFRDEIMDGLGAAANFALGALGSVGDAFSTAKDTVINAANSVLAFLSDNWPLIVSIVGGPVSALVVQIIQHWDDIKGAVSNGVDTVLSFVSNLGQLPGIVGDAMLGGVNAVAGGAADMAAIAAGIPGEIIGAVGDLGSILYNAGRAVIQGLINGMTSMLGSLRSVASSITNLIPDIKGPPEKDRQLLYNNGQLIMEGLNRGLMAGFERTVTPTLGGITRTLPLVGDGRTSGNSYSSTNNRSVQVFGPVNNYYGPGRRGRNELDLLFQAL